MSNIANQVKEECEKQLAPIHHIECIDHSDGCGSKLELIIVSDESFQGVPLLQRHRKVQKLLKDAGLGMDIIHALTIKAWTVEQWEKKKST
mmetsp:Transcript_7289/g.10431  ORF Transcript_7289/g.10431 Transcript_7289/m.10431 type:complete len:91 (+) Transcript_7289:100-372(+)|eukprot:CAMPEP_0184856068 /NCGR_PEP_ID=MMETSP0580-20130426/1224_1 /TAXON_ID=1118495 /ORGANISM="Dactyliosolen fragilissimus" /LENGTH=90 /DNA_ID=CAMNT_0027350843 /DNA_START=58 /DNA_END=330 /DNA_ORIENTATION=+